MGRGKGVGGRKRGKGGEGEGGGEIKAGHNGQERKREDIPVSVIPVTVEMQHSHI